MTKFLQSIQKYITFRNVMILGAMVVFVITLLEVTRGVDRNFQIFSNSTRDFWAGISPYDSEQWSRHGLDFFLYPPQFNVLFTPFAYLPSWLGPFVWNLFNFGMFAWAIWLLPYVEKVKKAKILLYLVPIIATTVMSFQYNLAVAYVFLFAFILMEKGKGSWAVLLIMISAFTKVYGGAELLILVLYPRFWQNVSWGLLWAAVLFVLPVIKVGFDGLMTTYSEWIGMLGVHKDSRPFETFFDISLFWPSHPSYMSIIQAVLFGVITVLTFIRLRWRNNVNYRIGVLAVIMGFVILFGNASEKHTYIIALAGFLYWLYRSGVLMGFEKVLYWSIFVIMLIVPIDLICPPVVMRVIFDDLDLNKWLFSVAWLYLCIKTYLCAGNNEIILERK